MKFSDFDFSKISQMLDAMSDEEKENLNTMAQDMMSNFHNHANEEDEEVDMYEFLGVDEDEYQDLTGEVLDQIEAAVDMERYYDEVSDIDYSASVLFYAKAYLNQIRRYLFPLYKNVLSLDGFNNEKTTTLSSYFLPLSKEENIYRLVDEGFADSSLWMEFKNNLGQVYILLNKAEFDHINKEELQHVKDILFSKQAFLQIQQLI